MTTADAPAVPTTGPVPLVDLGIQRDRIADEVAEGFARVLAATAFIQGPDVAEFEEEFAAFTGRGALRRPGQRHGRPRVRAPGDGDRHR